MFRNIPIIKNNFGLVTIAIIIVSVLPAVIAFLMRKKAPSPRLSATVGGDFFLSIEVKKKVS